MAKLSDVTSTALLSLIGNYNSTKGVLAINAASAATIKSTNAYTYTVNGVQYTKAALAAQSIAVTHGESGAASLGYVQPAGVTAYLTIALNAAGTVAVVQGTYAGQTNGSDPTVGVGTPYNLGTSFVGSGRVPDVPSGYTAIGVIKVVTAGAATFTPGTTLLDAANVTASYFDVAVLPAGLL